MKCSTKNAGNLSHVTLVNNPSTTCEGGTVKRDLVLNKLLIFSY